MSADQPKPSEVEEAEVGIQLPSAEELIRETSVAPPSVQAERERDERNYSELVLYDSMQRRQAFEHLQGLKDHYAEKKSWSGYLKWLLAGMIGAQWILLVCVGLGWWDFTQYQWLLPVLLVQNLGQVIGLAYVVVRSLFRDLEG
jgi:hypothetical protein